MGRSTTWEEKEKVKTDHAAARAANGKKADAESRAVCAELRKILLDCGLGRGQLSDFSGLVPQKISEFMVHYNRGLRLSSLIGLAQAAGYKITFEKLEAVADQYRSYRRVKVQ
jgi:hypothetical protein